MTRTFVAYHPFTNFMFFIGAIGLNMFISHPMFSLVSLILATSYYFNLNKGKSKKFLFGYVLLFITVVVFNGIINTMGDTVLFVWLKNRPVTAEVLVYGTVTAINFISVMLWFCCYNSILTTDKLTYLFGRFVPTVTLVLTMTLRLIPTLIKKIKMIVSARKCIGKGNTSDRYKDKLRSGLETLSILTSCALEDAVVTADSMRNRGYVDGHHTSYYTYTRRLRDIVVGVLYGITAIAVIVAIITGATSIQFFPVIEFPQTTIFTYIGIISYTVFLAIPLIIEFLEEIAWCILKLKI